jgi:phosphocarrier protein
VEICNLSILNALGLHARAAAKFVHTPGRFSAHVRVARGDRKWTEEHHGPAAARRGAGSAIRITADGPDESAAIAALCSLVERGFDEAPL